MENEFADWPKDSLVRVAGILTCNRMLYSYTPEKEAEIDRKIAALNEEIAARERASLTSTK